MTRKPELDLKKYPGMVRWFDPRVLLHEVKGVLLSAWFASYADQRFIQGSLDRDPPEKLIERADLSNKVVIDKDGAVWVDFVADIGDGFDATYTIAHLLAQNELSLPGQTALPRGSVLVIGGDLSYPSGSRDNYWDRMRQPYMLAYPNDARKSAYHPKMFAIPGNHDWYDGLSGFYGTFCRAIEREPYHGGLSIGNWRCKQSRSYFAINLPGNWCIWGVDIQLSGYIDPLQINYFRLIANKLEDGAKIIICTAKPSWLYAVEYGDSEFNSINYIARIAHEAKKTHAIKAIIAGDLHHYSRYHTPDENLQLVTAGGGGAFVHSTHQLKDQIDVLNIYQDKKSSEKSHTKFHLGKSNNEYACYPSRKICRRLLWRNIGFAFKNFDFSIGIGIIYWVVSWFFVSHEGGSLFAKWIEKARSGAKNPLDWFSVVLTDVATSPVLSALVFGVIFALLYYTDTRKWVRQYLIGITHSIVHIVLFLGLALSVKITNQYFFGVENKTFLIKALFAVEMIFLGGLLGGFVFGMYLLIASRWLNIHGEDAFSALRIDSYRNFLRLRLCGDTLTIYPIGVDEVPKRDAWHRNPKAAEGRPDSIYLPDEPLRPFLIEQPIHVQAQKKPYKKKPGGKEQT